MNHKLAIRRHMLWRKYFYLFIASFYVLLSVAMPNVVRAINTCTQADKCIDSEDLYSVNYNSPWYDPRLQNTNDCSQSSSSTAFTSDPNLTPKTPASFPTDATPQQKIAQTFVVGFDLSTGIAPSDVAAIVKKYHIGGLYFTGTADASGQTYPNTNSDYHHFDKTFFAALDKLAGTPLLIASDEEGATSSDNNITPIHRFAYGSVNFPTAKDMGSTTTTQIEKVGQDAGQQMQSYGITADLAPVLDVDNGKGTADQSVISKYGRAFSADANEVTKDADSFAKGLQESGITPVFKHFPGLGSAWNGTSQGNNTDAFKITGPSLAELKKKDLIPYQQLAGKDNAAIMLSNEYIPDWNGGTVPVSESPDAVKYLTSNLKFNGLIMTDSLTGPANYENGGSVARAIIRSEQAGANMVLFDSKGVDLQSVINTVRKSSLVATGTTKLDDSITKIIAFKNQTGTNSVGTDSNGNATCCTVDSSVSGSADGEKNKPIIWAYFTGKGLTPEQTSGIMGNMQSESGFEPERLQGTNSGVITPADQWENVNGGGWGLVQWTPGSKMINPTKDAKRDPNLLGTQLDFLWGQLYGKGKDLGASLPERDAGDSLKLQSSPESASNSFGKLFEGFAGSDSGGSDFSVPNYGDSNYQQRAAQARTIFVQFTKGGSVPTGADLSSNNGGASSCTSTFTSSTSGSLSDYKDPFHGAKVLANRVDGGVDYGFSKPTPVYAIGEGTVVVHDDYNSGWSGSFVAYKLSAGPAKGSIVYVAEGCKLNGGINIGSHVTSKTVVCTGQTGGYSIETGWAADPSTGFVGDYEKGNGYAGADSGCATVYGKNFSDLMKALGAPPGIDHGGSATGGSTSPTCGPGEKDSNNQPFKPDPATWTGGNNATTNTTTL